jgi:hypothetical protein
MKQILKTFLFTTTIAMVLFACEKVGPLVVYQNGVSPTLQASVTSIAPKVTDSLTTAVTFNWTNPKFATDSSTVKYVLQIDSSGRNFSNPASIVLTNKSSYSFVARELNAILLSFGFKYNTAYKVDVRIVSSYANNNDQIASNVLTLTMTPYVVPPKVTPPSSKALFLVGSATIGGWDNPVPVPTQQFTRVDSVTYQGKFYLVGGQQYLVLPVNGSWSNKYSVADNSKVGLNKGGDFGFNFSDNFPGPATTGIYNIKFDFQAGKFTVTLDKDFAYLYVAGGYQGWNPGAAPALASTGKDGNYSGYVYINAASEFKLTSQQDWSGTNYGAGAAGKISSSGGNLSVAGAGYYLINANTVTNDYSATATTWGVVGAFSGWGGSPDTQLTYSGGKWTGTLVLAADSELKFRANSGWDINLGDTGADGVLEGGGDNLKVTAGTYNVTLNLSNAGYYTYSLIKQ